MTEPESRKPEATAAEPEPRTTPGESERPPLARRDIWLRLLFMLLVGFIYGLTRAVVGAVVVLQFLWALFTASPNPRLLHFGDALAEYSAQMIRYVTFVTETRPFPFDEDWPGSHASAGDEPVPGR